MVSLQNSAQTQVKYTRTSIYLPPLRSHDKVHERLSQSVHYSSASTRQHTGVRAECVPGCIRSGLPRPTPVYI